MKKLTVIAVAALALVACCSRGGPGLELSPLAWPETEVNLYQVFIGDQPAGVHVQRLESGMLGELPVLEIEIVTFVGAETGETHDSAWVTLRRENLRPVHAARHVVTPDADIGSEIRYSKSSAEIDAATPVGDKSIEIPVGPLDYDNDQATTLLRAVDVRQGKPVEFNLVVGLAGATVPVRVSLAANESVSVPAGVFQCRRLEMEVAGQVIELWYENGGTNRMVKYAATASGVVMELVPAAPRESGADWDAAPPGEKPPRTGR